jgi:two-component system phosphate regulon response regulator PhoB
MVQLKTLVTEEDDHDIAQLLAVIMKKAGCEIGASDSGCEDNEPARSQQRGLLIVDLMIPGVEGLDLYEEIDRIIGLELGTDGNPAIRLNPRELLLRVRLILRSSGNRRQTGATFKQSGLEIDFEGHRATLHGHEIALTAVQFKLLSELISNQGKVMVRDHLLEKVWGYNFEGYARSVDTQISRLRRKLLSCGDLIETIRGVGYRFRN